MTIQELADRAAVTTRTIRYYVEQGVLPPPARGRPAEYTEEHLRLLALIRRLKEQYLPLDEIRDMLQGLTPGQVEEFLRRTGPQAQGQGPTTQDSAADYIAQVLNRGALRSQLKTEPPQRPPVSPPPAAPAPGRPGVRHLLHESYAASEAAQRSDAALGEVSAQTNFEPKPAAAHASQQQLGKYAVEERTWQRVHLAPGIELHYQAHISGTHRRAIERLIEAASTILGPHPEKGTEE